MNGEKLPGNETGEVTKPTSQELAKACEETLSVEDCQELAEMDQQFQQKALEGIDACLAHLRETKEAREKMMGKHQKIRKKTHRYQKASIVEQKKVIKQNSF